MCTRGSIVQKFRGYVRRNTDSPYGGTAGHYAGYKKDYHYDNNLLCNDVLPPFFPVVEPECGEEVELRVKSYGNN